MEYSIFNPNWPPIEGFSRYLINDKGEIWDTEREIQIHANVVTGGTLAVNLKNEDGQFRTRSVKLLVAKMFVPYDFSTDHRNVETFDTPILLDNDYRNVHASNIRWRPRWFAWKYTHQFGEIRDEYYRGPLRCFQDGLIFNDVISVGMHYGLLFDSIYQAAVAFETGDYSSYFYTWPDMDKVSPPIWPVGKSFIFIN